MGKIDLCKIIEVKELQAFTIQGTGIKFRVRENQLEFYSALNKDWLESPLEVNELAKYSEDIEVV